MNRRALLGAAATAASDKYNGSITTSITGQQSIAKDLNTQIDQLEEQVEGRDTLLGESHTHITLLEQ